MSSPKEIMEIIGGNFQKYWLDLADAIEIGEFERIDQVCRQIISDAENIKDLAHELKRKEVAR